MKEINEKYFTHLDQKPTINDVIQKDERILWRGVPHKFAYVWSRIISMLPIAVIWLIFDGSIIVGMFAGGIIGQIPTGVVVFLAFFFLLHLAPVWIWIAQLVKAVKQVKVIRYYITNRRIIIQKGQVALDFKEINFKEIKSIELKVGAVDKMLKVGDIYILSEKNAEVLNDLKDYNNVYMALNKILQEKREDDFPASIYCEYCGAGLPDNAKKCECCGASSPTYDKKSS